MQSFKNEHREIFVPKVLLGCMKKGFSTEWNKRLSGIKNCRKFLLLFCWWLSEKYFNMKRYNSNKMPQKDLLQRQWIQLCSSHWLLWILNQASNDVFLYRYISQLRFLFSHETLASRYHKTKAKFFYSKNVLETTLSMMRINQQWNSNFVINSSDKKQPNKP